MPIEVGNCFTKGQAAPTGFEEYQALMDLVIDLVLKANPGRDKTPVKMDTTFSLPGIVEAFPAVELEVDKQSSTICVQTLM